MRSGTPTSGTGCRPQPGRLHRLRMVCPSIDQSAAKCMPPEAAEGNQRLLGRKQPPHPRCLVLRDVHCAQELPRLRRCMTLPAWPSSQPPVAACDEPNQPPRCPTLLAAHAVQSSRRRRVHRPWPTLRPGTAGTFLRRPSLARPAEAACCVLSAVNPQARLAEAALVARTSLLETAERNVPEYGTPSARTPSMRRDHHQHLLAQSHPRQISHSRLTWMRAASLRSRTRECSGHCPCRNGSIPTSGRCWKPPSRDCSKRTNVPTPMIATLDDCLGCSP